MAMWLMSCSLTAAHLRRLRRRSVTTPPENRQATSAAPTAPKPTASHLHVFATLQRPGQEHGQAACIEHSWMMHQQLRKTGGASETGRAGAAAERAGRQDGNEIAQGEWRSSMAPADAAAHWP